MFFYHLASLYVSLNSYCGVIIRFTSHVIKAMMDLHKDVQPLDYIHLGGDEVDTKSWSESPKCSDFRGRLKR